MSNGRRCRRSVHQRDRGANPAAELDLCDECGLVVDPDEVAVLVAWVETARGMEPDWAFVGHTWCAELVSAHIQQVHGLPTHTDSDGSWLRKAVGE